MQNKIAFWIAVASAVLALVSASGKVPSWVSSFVLAVGVIILLSLK